MADGLTVGWHVVPGQQTAFGFFKSGLVLTTVLKLLGLHDDNGGRRELDDRVLIALDEANDATTVSVEGLADGVLTITGVGVDATPAALWRGAIEATQAEAARLLARIERVAGPTRRLVVTGGSARSAAFRAVKRAHLGPYDLPQVAEAGCRGAALLAGCATGIYGSPEEVPPPPASDVTRGLSGRRASRSTGSGG